MAFCALKIKRNLKLFLMKDYDAGIGFPTRVLFLEPAIKDCILTSLGAVRIVFQKIMMRG